MSASGRFVLFTSYASNLVPGDTNDKSDAFVRDLATARTERVSLTSAERQANGETQGWARGLGDGRYVAFTSYASNLVAHYTNGNVHVFVRYRGRHYATVPHRRDRQSRYCAAPRPSPTTPFLAFTSDSANLSSTTQQPRRRLRARPRQRHHPSGVGDQRREAGLPRGQPPRDLHRRGYVAFLSHSRSLVPGDTNRRRDVFVRDRFKGTTRRVSLATDESQLASHSCGRRRCPPEAATSPSSAGSSVLVRDSTAGTTQTVADDNGVPGWSYSRPRSGAALRRRPVRRVHVVRALVAGDTNLRYDVFVNDRDTGRSSASL